MFSYLGPDKPFKTTQEQINILKNRGLSIDNESFARMFLEAKNYHIIINSYKKLFTTINSNGNEVFITGTSFDDLVYFYYFDETLKNILFKYIIYFERSFNIAISNVFSSNYGVSMNRYLEKNHFNNRQGKVKSVLKQVWKIRSTKYNPTKHYRETKNHIPFWVLSQNMTFGEIRMLYSILNNSDKELIIEQVFNLSMSKMSSKEVETSKRLMKKILAIILDYRNNIAHGGNLVTYRSRSNARLSRQEIKLLWPQGIATKSTWEKQKLGRDDSYCLLICIMSGLIPNPFDKQSLAFELNHSFIDRFKNEKNFDLYLKAVGLPKNLEQYILNF